MRGTQATAYDMDVRLVKNKITNINTRKAVRILDDNLSFLPNPNSKVLSVSRRVRLISIF